MTLKRLFVLVAALTIFGLSTQSADASQCAGTLDNGGCQTCWGGSSSFSWQTRDCSDGSYHYWLFYGDSMIIEYYN